jgi:uncharacterized integral membrane protein
VGGHCWTASGMMPCLVNIHYLVLKLSGMDGDNHIDTDIDMLTAIGLTPSGCSTVHIYMQTIHRTTQLTTLNTVNYHSVSAAMFQQFNELNVNYYCRNWFLVSLYQHVTTSGCFCVHVGCHSYLCTT